MSKGTQMVNPERGEVLLEVKGANGNTTDSYVLLMRTNALVRLEQHMGDHIHKLGPRISSPGMGDLRALLCAALSTRHPEITLEGAGEIIDAAGFEEAGAAVMNALNLGFPRLAAGAAAVQNAGKVNGRGTGRGSSPTRRKRASVQPTSGS
ncbi:MAG: hypothetical protein H0U85_04190 [Gemmatimonadales bacterium]|nr:hypothetical protein [Gemmatimonadales bacterium]